MRRICVRFLSPLLAAAIAVPAAGPAAAYEAITVTGGGSIKGKVVFPGPPPPKRKIIPTKDKETCGGTREIDQIILGSDGGVAEAIVYLKGIEKGKAWPKAAKPPEIDNVKCDFQPHVQVMPTGDVVIVNSDPVLHNTKSFFDRIPVFNIALPNQGQRITRTIKRTGLMRIECDAHGWMLGWAYVADSPYFAITGKDGTFTIADVPPGAYTLVAWQEFTGATEVPVTVKAKEATSVNIELKKKK
jgi:hypothetical protein